MEASQDSSAVVRKKVQKKKPKKFREDSEGELIESGRASRRGGFEENVTSSEEESPQHEASDSSLAKGDLAQTAPSVWKKVKGKAISFSAVVSKVDANANNGPTGERLATYDSRHLKEGSEADFCDTNGEVSGSKCNVSIKQSEIACDGGSVQEFGEGEVENQEETKWAETQALSEPEEPGYRSIPGSRQGDVDGEDTNRDPNENLRACKSAQILGSTKDGRRHSSFHKSQSSPMLTEDKVRLEQRNRQKLDTQSKQKLPDTSEERPSEDVSQMGLHERLPGRASRRFSEVAAVVSVGNKFKNSPKNICPDLKEISNKPENSVKSTTGYKDYMLQNGKSDLSNNGKSVSWSDCSAKSPSQVEQDSATNSISSTSVRDDNVDVAAFKTAAEAVSNEDPNGQPTVDFNNSQDERTSTEEIWSKDNTETSDQNVSPPLILPSSESSTIQSEPSLPENVLNECVHFLKQMKDGFNAAEVKEDVLNSICVDLQTLEGSLTQYSNPTSDEIVHILALARDGIEKCMAGLLERTDLPAEKSTELPEDSSDNPSTLDNTFQSIIEECITNLNDQSKLVTESGEGSRTEEEAQETNITSPEADGTLVSPIEESSQIEESAKVDGQATEAESKKQESKKSKRASSKKSDESENRKSEKSSDDSENSEDDGSDSQEEDDSECSDASFFSEWPRFVCTIHDEHEEDTISCIVHADPDVVSFTQISCDVVKATSLQPVVREWETLAGKMIRLSAENLVQSSSTKCFLLALPYRRALVERWQDVRVMQLADNGDWIQLPQTKHKVIIEEEGVDQDGIEGTREPSFLRKQYYNNNKDGQSIHKCWYSSRSRKDGTCYAEVETDQLGTFAVVARSKVERITFGAAGGLIHSSVDHRVTVKIAENTCYGHCAMTLQVSYPDPCSIFDFRSIKEENSSFKACTPIVEIEFTEDITNAVHLSVPMVMPQRRLVRAGSRPGTSRQAPVPDPFDPKELLLFQKTSICEWKLIRYAKVSNTDSSPGNVTFEWFEKKGRLAVVCIAKDILRKTIDPKASVFLTYLTLKPVEITIDQDPSCNYKISASVGPKQFGVKRRRLRKDETQHIFTNDAMLREGQPFDLNLRGNLTPNSIFPKRFIFYAVETNCFTFDVTISDRFTQRSLPYYCGFVQLIDPLHLMAEPRMEIKGKVPPIFLEKPIILTEICVKIDKPPPQPLQPLVRAPLNVRLNGGVSFETLREVALQFADEWKKLARSLHVSHARVQSILRNTKGKQPEHIALEVLLSWVKRVPISQDKACLLCEALTRCGRPDLVIGIREKDRQKKQNEIHQATSYNLKKAILIVSRSPTVVFQWRTLVTGLGLSNVDVGDVECLPLNDQEICHLALERWQSTFKATATVKVLAKQLMLMGCFHVSELISTAYGNV